MMRLKMALPLVKGLQVRMLQARRCIASAKRSAMPISIFRNELMPVARTHGREARPAKFVRNRVKACWPAQQKSAVAGSQWRGRKGRSIAP
jgi:hypothetical protein